MDILANVGTVSITASFNAKADSRANWFCSWKYAIANPAWMATPIGPPRTPARRWRREKPRRRPMSPEPPARRRRLIAPCRRAVIQAAGRFSISSARLPPSPEALLAWRAASSNCFICAVAATVMDASSVSTCPYWREVAARPCSDNSTPASPASFPARPPSVPPIR